MPLTTPRHFSVGFFIGVFLAVAGAQSAAQDKAASPAPVQSAEDAKRRASPVPASELKWDGLAKSYEGKPGDTVALFEFRVTNTSAAVIAIESILTSCGCTVAELSPLPAAPFVLEPSASTTIRVSLDLHGKMGTVSKSVTVGTSSGLAVLTVNATVAPVPDPSVNVAGIGADGARNIEIATSDRQGIFKRVPASELKWDALSKSYEGRPGDTVALFEFRVTNTSSSSISIESILTSCGCTVAELPPLPAAHFVLEPAASTTIRVSLDLNGKAGSISKSVTVGTSVGLAILTVNATIAAVPAPSVNVGGMGADRAKNIEIATTDRQAIFKGECAKCHATPAAGKMDQELYRAVCTICHEASPRASMIPDLNIPRGPRDLEFWNKWISEGGPGTMMPAFAASKGGPLNEEQVASLALYLFAEFSRVLNSAQGSRPPAQMQK